MSFFRYHFLTSVLFLVGSCFLAGYFIVVFDSWAADPMAPEFTFGFTEQVFRFLNEPFPIPVGAFAVLGVIILIQSLATFRVGSIRRELESGRSGDLVAVDEISR